MGLASRLAGQLAAPSGRAGRWLGRAMDLANAKVNARAIDLLRPQKGERILDAGCGTGAALAEVLRRAPCTAMGVDRSETMIDAACRRLGTEAALQVGALEMLGTGAARVDGALLLNVLYFCGPDAAMVRAVHRHLKPGGRVVVYVTHRATMERWAFARAGHHRLFDERELAQLLAAGGFAPSSIAVHEERVARFVRGLFGVARR